MPSRPKRDRQLDNRPKDRPDRIMLSVIFIRPHSLYSFVVWILLLPVTLGLVVAIILKGYLASIISDVATSKLGFNKSNLSSYTYYCSCCIRCHSFGFKRYLASITYWHQLSGARKRPKFWHFEKLTYELQSKWDSKVEHSYNFRPTSVLI